MATIPLNGPTAKAPSKAALFIVIALLMAMGVFSLGLISAGFLTKPLGGNSTPLKPCASCPTCACPKMLGAVKCLCAK